MSAHSRPCYPLYLNFFFFIFEAQMNMWEEKKRLKLIEEMSITKRVMLLKNIFSKNPQLQTLLKHISILL